MISVDSSDNSETYVRQTSSRSQPNLQTGRDQDFLAPPNPGIPNHASFQNSQTSEQAASANAHSFQNAPCQTACVGCGYRSGEFHVARYLAVYCLRSM